MGRDVMASVKLMVASLVLGVVIYPGLLWVIGQTVFHDQAEGSLIRMKDASGKEVVVGSRLIAQPFTGDEYFQPRPSAASYNAAASAASNWSGNSYLLRDRVARALGPIVKYHGPAAKKGQPVGPDVEAWFRKDQFQGKPGIVALWADAHNTVAQNWVKADKLNGAFVKAWAKEHPDDMAGWKKANPDTPESKPEDLAVPFFKSYSKAFPGTFPSIVEHRTADGKGEKKVEPVREGTDIQAAFFDLWLQEHPDADLEKVPADLVMASGSGLDPHLTLKSALYQLDRVAGKWAGTRKQDKALVRREIEELLRQKAGAPLGGLAGVPMVNVLELNLALKARYGGQAVATR